MDSVQNGEKRHLHTNQNNVSLNVIVNLKEFCEKTVEKLVVESPDGPKITMKFSSGKRTSNIPSSTCSPPNIFEFEIEGNCINGQDHVNLIKFTLDNKLCAGEETYGNCTTKMASENEGRNQTKLLKVIPSQPCRTEPSQRKRPKITSESSCKAKSAPQVALKPNKKIEVNRRTELPMSDSQGNVNKVSIEESTTATATSSTSSGAGYLETCSFRDIKAPKKRISRCLQQQSGRGRGEAAEGVQQVAEFEQQVQKRLCKYLKILNDKQKAEYKAEFTRKYEKYLELYESVRNFNLVQNCVQPNERQKKAINEYNLLHAEMNCIKELIKEYQELVDKYEDEESVDEYENELCF